MIFAEAGHHGRDLGGTWGFKNGWLTTVMARNTGYKLQVLTQPHL